MAALSDAALRLAMTATGYDMPEALTWIVKDDELRVFVQCNDVFEWGTADGEEVTDDNVLRLVTTVAEVQAIVGKYEAMDAPLLWCARQRRTRPQGAFYQHLDKPLWHLFDAAGPERTVGLLNPRPHPRDLATQE